MISPFLTLDEVEGTGLPFKWIAPLSIAPFYTCQSGECPCDAPSPSTYIVLDWAVPELILEDVQNLASSPSLFAERVVREVIWCDSSQSPVENVRSWPGIAGRNGDFGRRREYFRVVLLFFHCHDSHARGRNAPFP